MQILICYFCQDILGIVDSQKAIPYLFSASSLLRRYTGYEFLDSVRMCFYRYDAKSLICGWHDLASLSFAIFLMTIAIFVPLVIMTYCYFQVCR